MPKKSCFYIMNILEQQKGPISFNHYNSYLYLDIYVMVNIQGKDEWVTFKKVEITQQPLDMYSLSVKVFKTILEVSSYTTIIGVKFGKRIHIIIFIISLFISLVGIYIKVF